MKYPKIMNVFKRHPDTHKLIPGLWSCPEFRYLQHNSWEATEKIDGTNIRLYREGPAIRGRTNNSQLHTGLVEVCNQIIQSDAFMELPEDMVLYGEGYGPGIQKGGERYRDTKGFILFDAWCRCWLERSSVRDIAGRLGVPHVPVIGTGTIHYLIDMVRKNLKSEFGEFPAEGIVARPLTELLNRKGERIIVKIKEQDFRDGFQDFRGYSSAMTVADQT